MHRIDPTLNLEWCPILEMGPGECKVFLAKEMRKVLVQAKALSSVEEEGWDGPSDVDFPKVLLYWSLQM